MVVDVSGGGESVPGGFRRKLPATVTVSRQMPQALRDQGMLIYANGQWLVDAEPNYR